MLDYIKQILCPLCNGESYDEKPININSYHFGGLELNLPKNGIKLRHCKCCGLYYKDYVPTMDSISSTYNLYAHSVWKHKLESYTYELNFLMTFKKTSLTSLIDIGSSDGGFVKKASTVIPLVSALDIYFDQSCADAVSGEYIIGFIESLKRDHSRKYDFVSAFDVFEHFYNPVLAGNHIIDLMSNDGILFGETGDTDKVGSPENWWYVKYFEHHIFWNKSSLQFFANKMGFDIVKLHSCSHKGRRYMNPFKRLLAFILNQLSWWDRLKSTLLNWRGIDISMLGNTYLKDHMFFALKRK